MSDKKTILFNDSFMTSMGGSKTKKNKKPKKEKPIQAVKPNKLKQDLLEKIKKHQQNEKIKKNPDENTLDDSSGFHNDFMDSLEYLNNLSVKEKMQKRKRKQKQKTLKNPIQHNTVKPNISFDNSQMISLDLPSDFNLQPLANTMTNLNNMISQPITNNNNNISGSTDVIPKNINNVIKPPFMIEPDTPYGCLKGGSKPTYRQYHNKTLKHNPSHNSANNSIQHAGNSSRQSQLAKLKKSYKKIKQKTKKTKKSTYKLGRTGKNISVLIKNNKTRRNIKREHGLLKQKPLQDIKRYLYEKNLLKIGSSTPNDVLRTMYEQSILAGDITNTNNTVTVHNYLNK
jgi:hypothetical protein